MKKGDPYYSGYSHSEHIVVRWMGSTPTRYDEQPIRTDQGLFQPET